MENAHDKPAKIFCYQEEMNRLSVACPPADFAVRETVAFRWVFEPIDDEQNFLPQYFKNPDRFNEKEDKVKCQALGLSLFNSAADAQRQFSVLQKYLKEDAMSLGTHLATGIIQRDFGFADLPNPKGHFTLHPFENVSLLEHFEIISTL